MLKRSWSKCSDKSDDVIWDDDRLDVNKRHCKYNDDAIVSYIRTRHVIDTTLSMQKKWQEKQIQEAFQIDQDEFNDNDTFSDKLSDEYENREKEKRQKRIFELLKKVESQIDQIEQNNHTNENIIPPTTFLLPSVSNNDKENIEEKEEKEEEEFILPQKLRRLFRPRPQLSIEDHSNIQFMLTEIDWIPNHNQMIIRLFGTTINGNSIVVYTHGFYPYFYIECGDINCSDKDMNKLYRQMNQYAISCSSWHKPQMQNGKPTTDKLIGWEPCRNKMSIMGYQSNVTATFMKIIISSPGTAHRCAQFLRKQKDYDYKLFELNVDPVMRFLLDTKLQSSGWINIDCTKDVQYRDFNHCESHCQIEMDVKLDQLSMVNNNNNLQQMNVDSIAALVIASFDIECLSSSGFCDATRLSDEIIIIATTILIHDNDNHEFYRHVIISGSCEEIINAEVVCVANERELLLAWYEFLIKSDPDILMGYNSTNFDLPYIMDRAKLLKIPQYNYLGRILKEKSDITETTTSTKAQGTQKNSRITMAGRIQLDMYRIIQRNHKLSSYKLNAVASHFLKDNKEDVPYSCISTLYNGSKLDRTRLCKYCIKDTILPLQLLLKLQTIISLVEMSRVTGVTILSLVQRGQQYKCFWALVRAAHFDNNNYLIPYQSKTNNNNDDEEKKDDNYVGATVFEPIKGLYYSPIATLDFASLYPSIMIAYNLSYETLITSKTLQPLPLSIHEFTTDDQQTIKFVKNDIKPGILPKILINLLNARKLAKKMMAEAKTDEMRNIYNGRQLALKVTCNSLYGFTGATAGFLTCLQIASTVTLIGRGLISQTKSLIEQMYNNATVVYGDSDSVMVDFNIGSCQVKNDINHGVQIDHNIQQQLIEKCQILAAEAAQRISDSFPDAIELEFEKIYCPYMLLSKKRYAGITFVAGKKNNKGYLDVKGLQNVRRDNCLLVRETIQQVLFFLLEKGHVESAKNVISSTISEIIGRKYNLHRLILSKKLSKLKYKTKVPHAELYKKLKQRDPSCDIQVGDRIPYVVIENGKKSVAERAEDPLYVMQHNLSIDVNWYIQNQLKKPVEEIFKLVMPRPSDLFAKKETLHVRKVTQMPKIMENFLVVQRRCLTCNCPCSAPTDHGISTVLCAEHIPLANEFQQSKLKELENMKDIKKEQWNTCIKCTGSTEFAQLCRNIDCSTLFHRHAADQKVHDLEDIIQRLQSI